MTKITGLTKPTVYAIFPLFEKMGLVKKTRNVGNAVIYTANKQSVIYKNLQKFILETCIPEKTKKEIVA